jgi:hypothetical protein
MIEPVYGDLKMNTHYPIEKIGSYVKIQGNPRHYLTKYFICFKDGKQITKVETKRYLQMKKIMKKLEGGG